MNRFYMALFQGLLSVWNEKKKINQNVNQLFLIVSCDIILNIGNLTTLKIFL